MIDDREYIPDEFNALLDIEEAHRRNLTRYTDAELIKMFRPEVNEIVQAKISEYEDERSALEKTIRCRLAVIMNYDTDDFSKWCARQFVKLTLVKELIQIEKHLYRLKRQGNLIKGRKPRDGLVTRDQIDQAMVVPIQNLIPGPFRKAGKNLICLCPLHNEKTPSFSIYTATNSCFCFGCQQGGNTIKLVQLLHGYNFIEAVKYLLNLI